MANITALLAGLVFGLGLVVSGMAWFELVERRPARGPAATT